MGMLILINRPQKKSKFINRHHTKRKMHMRLLREIFAAPSDSSRAQTNTDVAWKIERFEAKLDARNHARLYTARIWL